MDEIARWTAIIRDALTGSAAVVGAVVAIIGLRAWKRQLLWKANYELAGRLMRSTYSFREAIAWLRSPLVTAGEMAAALKAAGLDDQDRTFTDPGEELAYQARWRKVIEAQVEFSTAMLEAEALWGHDVRKHRDAFAPIMAELYMALRHWVNRRDRDNDVADKALRIISDLGEESKAFSDKLAAAFNAVEDAAQPHLKP
jgi:hypothetical protein